METLATYRGKVQKEVDDASTASTEVIDEIIKGVYHAIMVQAGKFLVGATTKNQSTVIDQTAYTTDTDISEIIYVGYQDSGSFNELEQITYKDYLKTFINSNSGTPTKYFMDGRTLNIAPKPVAVGTLRIIYRPIVETLTGDSLWPDRYTQALIDECVARFKAYEDNPSAENYDGWYSRLMKEAMLDLSNINNTFTPKLWS